MIFDIVFAAFLLSGPIQQEPIPSEESWPVIKQVIQELAINWEILDKRETTYILDKREEFSNDVNLLRRRVLEFENVPHLADFNRFPPRPDINDLIRLNRTHRAELEKRRVLEFDLRGRLTEAIRETDTLYQVWDAARDSRCEFYYVTVRRQALAKLRDYLGDDAYYRGQMPPAIYLSHLGE